MYLCGEINSVICKSDGGDSRLLLYQRFENETKRALIFFNPFTFYIFFNVFTWFHCGFQPLCCGCGTDNVIDFRNL